MGEGHPHKDILGMYSASNEEVAETGLTFIASKPEERRCVYYQLGGYNCMWFKIDGVNDDDEEEELEEAGQHQREEPEVGSENEAVVHLSQIAQPTPPSSPKPSRTASGGGRGGALVRKESSDSKKARKQTAIASSGLPPVVEEPADQDGSWVITHIDDLGNNKLKSTSGKILAEVVTDSLHPQEALEDWKLSDNVTRILPGIGDSTQHGVLLRYIRSFSVSTSKTQAKPFRTQVLQEMMADSSLDLLVGQIFERDPSLCGHVDG